MLGVGKVTQMTHACVVRIIVARAKTLSAWLSLCPLPKKCDLTCTTTREELHSLLDVDGKLLRQIVHAGTIAVVESVVPECIVGLNLYLHDFMVCQIVEKTI